VIMAASEQGANAVKEEEQVVSPWEVSALGGKGRHRLRQARGPVRVPAPQRRARPPRRAPHSRPPHVFVRRDLFFAHWDFRGRSSTCTRGGGPRPRRCTSVTSSPSCSPSKRCSQSQTLAASSSILFLIHVLRTLAVLINQLMDRIGAQMCDKVCI